jgi:hypothetical protein
MLLLTLTTLRPPQSIRCGTSFFSDGFVEQDRQLTAFAQPREHIWPDRRGQERGVLAQATGRNRESGIQSHRLGSERRTTHSSRPACGSAKRGRAKAVHRLLNSHVRPSWPQDRLGINFHELPG